MKAETRLRAVPWLVVVRAGIGLVGLACLVFYVFSLVQYYQQVLNMNQAVLPSSNWTPEGFRQSLALAGESASTYAIFHIVLVALFSLGYLGVAGLLLAQKPGERMALLVAFCLVTFGTGFPPPIQSLKYVFPGWGWAVDLWGNLGFTLFFLLFYIFPDGRFVPGWTRWLGVYWILVGLVGPLFPGSFLDAGSFQNPWNDVIPLFMFASFIAAQVYRYRRVSGPLQRLQTRWVVTGMVIALSGLMITWFASLIVPALDHPGLLGIINEHVLSIIYVVGFLLVPLSLGTAILRYRLFDIDLIIRRTLVYSLLTALLGLLYFGSVVVLEQVMGGITGESAAAIVLSTLLIAALFSPLRRRVQSFIDRRFYRQKYDAERALEQFSAAARHEVELECLTGKLVEVVEKTVQPDQVLVWMRNVRRET